MRILIASLLSVMASTATAQVEHTPAHCLAMVDNGPTLQKASLQALQKDEVRLTFIDHSMYRIDTFGDISVVTDFNGYIGRDADIPEVVTMNNAHSSHWTTFIPDGVQHVLPGWRQDGQPANHELDLGELRIRNVTTDIRSSFSGARPDGNSIFIFEVGGLCIGHLGHLHQEPNDVQYAMIGRLDVVMANADGGVSLNTETMVRVMKRFRASVVLPMHYHRAGTLDRFLASMKDEFEIVEVESASLIVSQDTLPTKPTVYILPPQLFGGYVFDGDN